MVCFGLIIFLWLVHKKQFGFDLFYAPAPKRAGPLTIDSRVDQVPVNVKISVASALVIKRA